MEKSVLSELNKIVASRGQHSAREAREMLIDLDEQLRDFEVMCINYEDLPERAHDKLRSIINLLTG